MVEKAEKYNEINMNRNSEGVTAEKDDIKIPPDFIENARIEKIAADINPTSAGSWWIMLQTAMSIYNCAVSRDPVNNSVLDEFWHDIAVREKNHGIIPLLERGGIRPLPYDDLMEIISYCGDQLQNVIKEPRHSIVKIDKMVMPNKIRNTGTRTMDWLGKQPGKTIKEKLSGKNKMLTQVNEYSYDIKENQVSAMLYKMLYKRVNDRIYSGIETFGYDSEYTSPNIEKMFKLRKEMRKSELSDVKPINHTQANNVLLADKNYSIIWKAYLEMCKYDKRIADKWTRALDMYVYSVYLSVNAMISNYLETQTLEKRINLQTDSACEVMHVIGHSTKNPLLVKVSYKTNVIHLCVSSTDVNGNGEKILSKYKLVFSACEEDKLFGRHGYPLKMCVHTAEPVDDVKFFADLEGLCMIVDWCLNQLENIYGSEFHKVAYEDQTVIGTCTFDVLSDGIYTTVDEDQMPYTFGNKAVVYCNGEERKVFKGTNNGVFLDATDQIKISDAVNEHLQTEALMNALEDLSNRVTLKQDDYFIYTVPDALEEFSQKNLKQCVNTWFHRAFPVWRSVAALTEILTIPNVDIRPEDIFISIDLMGEIATAGLLTLKSEKRINGYVCNHYPPFPESDAGERITERAFIINYIVKYLEKYKIDFSEDLPGRVAETGLIQSVLLDGNIGNYIIENSGKVQILQFLRDDILIQRCKEEWLSEFKTFWRDIKPLFPKTIQFVNILNDCVMTFIPYDEVRSIVGKNEDFADIFLSNSSNINKGAFLYRDRLRKHQPTWTEYLPELSLEVIKNGMYDQLQLIGDDVSFDVMGEDNEHIVEEKLLLKAGEKEFRFPLLKKDISRTSSMIEAFITDRSFPLNHDVIVCLSVKYKYGYDNSYELTLKPLDEKETSFEEIIVEWENVSRESNLVNIWPPNTNLQPDDNVRVEIEETKDSLIRIEQSIEKHMVNYVGVQDKSYPIKQTDNFLNRNIFKIRNITMSKLPEADDFVKWFISTDLYKYLGQIAGIFKCQDIPDEFFVDNKSRDLEFFKGDCLQVMFSIGAKIPEVIQKHYISRYYEVNDKYRMKAMIDLLLINSSNTAAIMTIIDEIRNAGDQDEYSIKMDGLVKELGKMCCFDSDLIYGFNNVDQSFVSEMTMYISNGLKRQLSRCEKRGDSYRPQRKDTKRFTAYLEAILALLRLRNPEKAENFELLAVGSEESKKLSNIIKKLDDYMQHPRSGVRFNTDILDKPESLSKMSDLSYALDLYLNGDKKAASIEVVGVDEED